NADAAMSRLYVVESAPISLGTLADYRLAFRVGDVEGFALALAERLGLLGALAGPSNVALEDGGAAGCSWGWRFLEAAADALRVHAGRSVVIAGEFASLAMHALVHGINAVLGNFGSIVWISEPVEPEPADQAASLR